MAAPALGVAVGVVLFREKAPTDAKMRKLTVMPMPPTIKERRRPNRSTMYRPKKVMPKLTPPRIMAVTNELLIPVAWKIVVP